MEPCWRLCFVPSLLGLMWYIAFVITCQLEPSTALAQVRGSYVAHHKALESSPVFLGSDHRCTLVPQPPQHGLPQATAQTRQVVLFEVAHGQYSPWAMFLRHHTFCAVAHINANITSLLGVVELLRQVPKSHVVFASHQKPEGENLLRHRRKLYWTKEAKQVLFFFYLFPVPCNLQYNV